MRVILALKRLGLISDVKTATGLVLIKRNSSYSNTRMDSVCFPDSADLRALSVKKPFTIFVEGNIGSGKTTFLNHFSKYDAMILSEPVELWRNVRGHNMLDLMYKDPSRWSLAFQTIVQKTMLDLHIRPTTKPVKMMERSIYSARYCFVENLHRGGALAAPDYAVLDEWFRWINCHMDTCGDLIVYLRTDPEVVHSRMMARARSEEAQVPLLYLQQLHELHENWLIRQTAFSCPAPVIVVDANKDLSNMEEEYEKCELEMLGKGSVFSVKQNPSPMKQTCSPLKQTRSPLKQTCSPSKSLIETGSTKSPRKLVF